MKRKSQYAPNGRGEAIVQWLEANEGMHSPVTIHKNMGFQETSGGSYRVKLQRTTARCYSLWREGRLQRDGLTGRYGAIVTAAPVVDPVDSPETGWDSDTYQLSDESVAQMIGTVLSFVPEQAEIIHIFSPTRVMLRREDNTLSIARLTPLEA